MVNNDVITLNTNQCIGRRVPNLNLKKGTPICGVHGYKNPASIPTGLVLILFHENVQTCAEKRDCFAKHQPGVAGCGWLQPGRKFLTT